MWYHSYWKPAWNVWPGSKRVSDYDKGHRGPISFPSHLYQSSFCISSVSHKPLFPFYIIIQYDSAIVIPYVLKTEIGDGSLYSVRPQPGLRTLLIKKIEKSSMIMIKFEPRVLVEYFNNVFCSHFHSKNKFSCKF